MLLGTIDHKIKVFVYKSHDFPQYMAFVNTIIVRYGSNAHKKIVRCLD